jgi:hypothetical protein
MALVNAVVPGAIKNTGEIKAHGDVETNHVAICHYI